MASAAPALATAKQTADAPIAFIDLQAQRRRLGPSVEAAIKRVLEHGAFIMGPEITELEAQLGRYAGVKHVLSCASGTDALVLPLMAKGIGAGDAVFCPAFTFAASAEAIVLVGGSPVFVDVDPVDFNMIPASLEAAIAEAEAKGLTPRAVMPVDLFGQPADYPGIEAIAARHGLWILADAAQSFGARLDNRRVGSIGHVAATSFFPAKPLGCYGDGGAVFTDDDGLIEIMRSLRIHGQGSDKYENVRVGINGRMDTIQAAVLLQKLTIFEEEIEARDRVATRYAHLLQDVVEVPRLKAGRTSVWAQYTIRLPNRDQVAERMKADGIPTAIYYPRPLHRQAPYAGYPADPAGLPNTDKMAGLVLSLPMHPYLDEATQDRIVASLKRALV